MIRYMTEREYFRERRQITNLPGQLEAARRRVRDLENKARRYGMTELLTNPQHLDDAWDRTVWKAQEAVEAHGGSIGFGEAGR